MKWQDVPALVRHSTIAIYNKSTGGGADGFIKALRISRDTLAKQGYVYSAPGLGVLQEIRLTSKGWIRNRQHESEGRSGADKDRQFEQLWKSIEPKIPVLDGPSGEQSPTENRGDAVAKEHLGPKPGEKQKGDNRESSLYPPPKK